MRVKLLKDVLEDGKVKTTIKSAKRLVIGWFQGTELEVSQETGKKLVDRGDAQEVVVVSGEVAEA